MSAQSGPSQQPSQPQQLSTQTMPHAIKLPVPAPYRGEMDYEIIEAWIFTLQQYFLLTGLTEPIGYV